MHELPALSVLHDFGSETTVFSVVNVMLHGRRWGTVSGALQ
jgi:hypothetical protein